MRVELTFRKGFPLIAEVEIASAEPDVGYPTDYISDYRLLTQRGQPTDFLNITTFELEEIEEKLRRIVFAEPDFPYNSERY